MTAASPIQYTTGQFDGTATTYSSMSETFGADVTAGSLLVAAFCFSTAHGTDFTITDTHGNTWQSAHDVIDPAGEAAGLWYADGAVAGPTTVTITYTGGTSNFGTGLVCAEYDSSFVATDGGNGQPTSWSGTTDSGTSGTWSTADDDDLIVGVVVNYSNHALFAGTGFTVQKNLTSGGTGFAVQDMIAGIHGTTAATCDAAGSCTGIVLGAAFSAAGVISGSWTGAVGTADAQGIPGTFSGTSSSDVAVASLRSVAIRYVSGFAASGSAATVGTYTVPVDASIVVVSGGNASITAIDVAASAGHTLERIVGYDPTTMPLAVDLWHNSTGTSQAVTITVTPTWVNNKTLGVGVYLISGCGATVTVKATLTGSTTNPELAGTPTVTGSLMCLHYLQQATTAIVSSFDTGTTGDATAGYGIGNSGSDEMGLGTLYQSAANSQTSSPVTVGAGAPSAVTFAALVEYVPSDASIGGAFQGAKGTAAAVGVPGVFTGTDFVGAVGAATAAGTPGTFDGTTVISGVAGTATAHGIPGTFTGTIFQAGAFPGAVGTATATGIPGSYSSGDVWTGHVGAATAHGIPGTFSNTSIPLRNITITIGPITGGWTADTADGGWTADLPNGGWAGDAPDGGWADSGITA